VWGWLADVIGDVVEVRECVAGRIVAGEDACRSDAASRALVGWPGHAGDMEKRGT